MSAFKIYKIFDTRELKYVTISLIFSKLSISPLCFKSILSNPFGIHENIKSLDNRRFSCMLCISIYVSFGSILPQTASMNSESSLAFRSNFNALLFPLKSFFPVIPSYTLFRSFTVDKLMIDFAIFLLRTTLCCKSSIVASICLICSCKLPCLIGLAINLSISCLSILK
ncbi:unnamed protein product [Moneuplotes crassus]|uniref:Uncharacterized protein n=1 Tax=Euplotes crassus TaxID=5936 RepID=A0AAD1UNZ8_EUPCR|nr:unnamed protein product [Moneuplotes crassus]